MCVQAMLHESKMMTNLLSAVELSKITGRCICDPIKALIETKALLPKGTIPKPVPVKPKTEIM